MNNLNRPKKTAVIISISSDIGYALAKKYSELEYNIVGTYRSEGFLEELKQIPNCDLFYCDINKRENVDEFVGNFQKSGLEWDLLISCPCNPLPFKPFFDCDFDAWERSTQINVTDQLRVLHGLYDYRNKEEVPSVVFFSGAGTNSAVVNFSAYAAPKIMLNKMCELLDAENRDMKFSIVGPGWVKTKTHNRIMDSLDESDPKYIETYDFMQGNGGTSMEDIFECIRWIELQGKEVVGGRNFAVVNDDWNGPKKERLINELKSDNDMYKLRRHKNEWGKD